MDGATFDLLKSRASNDWVGYECHRLAFLAASRRCRRGAQLLAWLTILFAALTTAVSGGEALAQRSADDAVGYVVLALAILTTMVAAIRQTFKWEEKTRTYYARSIEIANLQRTLHDYLESIARRTKAEDPTFLSNLQSRVQGLLDPEVDRAERFGPEAQREWDRSHASRLILLAPAAPPIAEGAGAAPVPPEPADADVEEAAEGIEPIIRGESQ